MKTVYKIGAGFGYSTVPMEPVLLTTLQLLVLKTVGKVTAFFSFKRGSDGSDGSPWLELLLRAV